MQWGRKTGNLIITHEGLNEIYLETWRGFSNVSRMGKQGTNELFNNEKIN